MLEVKGKIVDTVVRVTSNTAGDIRSMYRVFEELDGIFHSMQSYPTGQDPSDIEWRLLVADLDAWGSKLPASARDMPIFGWHKAYREYLQQVFAMDDSELKVLNEDTDRSAWSQRKWDFTGLKAFSQGYWDALRRVFDNTGLGRLGTTQRGYVGVFPIGTQDGDIVTILYGASTPFILRKSREINSTYKVVGECYIHGIMEGEALRLEGIKAMKILIC